MSGSNNEIATCSLWCLHYYCQAQAVITFVLENIVFLYFRFYIDKCDKLIRLTVFHCESTATQNVTFTVVV